MSPEKIEDDFLAEVLPEGEIGAEIVLEEPAQADHQIQRIARLMQKQKEIEAFVQEEMKRLQEYLERKLKTLQGEIDWRSGPLEIYMRDANRRNPKIKSLDLPHGKLKLHAKQDQLILEEDKVWGWINRHPVETDDYSLVKTTREIQKSSIKDFIKKTGEVVDGVTIVPAGEPSFKIVVKESEEKGGEPVEQ
jgi:type IV secretory pathway VirB4 component